MSVCRLILREILYRKLNFLLGVLSVLVAVGCLVAEFAFLEAHDRRTSEVLAAREAETAQRVKQLEQDTRQRLEKLEDDIRKQTVAMGFNLLILPKDQSLADLFAEDFASKSMPEEYAERLAKARVATINHLLPSLQQKLVWPEQQRTILVMGVRGEVLIHSAKQKPILEAVPPGAIVLGYELHQSMKLKVGDQVTMKGKEFTVHNLHPVRGGKDDITVWINLKEAQELFDKAGQINAMLALECNCSADRVSKIRAEIGSILPETQVVEFHSQAVMRAESRTRVAVEAKAANDRAAAEARAALDQEREGRTRLRQEREAFAAVLVPAVLLGAGVWVSFLAFANVRARRGEIGILRALGLRSSQVLGLFLGKAALVGLLGAVLGSNAGFVVAALLKEPASSTAGLITPGVLLLVLVAAPLLACLASWLPALIASQQDPAVVLREE